MHTVFVFNADTYLKVSISESIHFHVIQVKHDILNVQSLYQGRS